MPTLKIRTVLRTLVSLYRYVYALTGPAAVRLLSVAGVQVVAWAGGVHYPHSSTYCVGRVPGPPTAMGKSHGAHSMCPMHEDISLPLILQHLSGHSHRCEGDEVPCSAVIACAGDFMRQPTADVLLLCVTTIDQADEALLPSLYLEVCGALDVGPAFLGAVTLCRGIAQSLASTLAGPLGAA